MIALTFLLVNENGTKLYNLAFNAAFWFSRLWDRHVFENNNRSWLIKQQNDRRQNTDHKPTSTVKYYPINNMHAPSKMKVQTDKTDIFQQFCFKSRFHFCSRANRRVFNCRLMCKLHVLWKTKGNSTSFKRPTIKSSFEASVDVQIVNNWGGRQSL